jgi:hypothetical protein
LVEFDERDRFKGRREKTRKGMFGSVYTAKHLLLRRPETVRG